MAPRAMRIPTLPTVAPTPLVKLSMAALAPSAGGRPSARRAEDQREERVHAHDDDEHHHYRYPEQRGEDELSGSGGGGVGGDERM